MTLAQCTSFSKAQVQECAIKMAKESQAVRTLKLLPLQVSFVNCSSLLSPGIKHQVLMMNKDGEAKNFTLLADNDKDLIMFTITDLRLEKISKQVLMIIVIIIMIISSGAHDHHLEEEDPDGDVDHLPAHLALADLLLRDHLLQTRIL